MGRTYSTLVRVLFNLKLNAIFNSRINKMAVCHRKKHPESNEEGDYERYVAILFYQIDSFM